MLAILPVLAFGGEAWPAPSSAEAQITTLVAQYPSASDIMRPNVARRIERQLRGLPKTAETNSVRAEALIILSRQASFDRRKDFALKVAREAAQLAGSLSGPSAKSLVARAAIAETQSLLQHEQFVQAITQITAARRAYGRPVAPLDQVWDELALWGTIALASTPSRLAARAEALNLTETEEMALLDPEISQCQSQFGRILRQDDVGRMPAYPVLSLLSNLQGGVVIRSSVNEVGQVLSAHVTAFAPTEGFAAAAENAVPTWAFTVPADAPANCRANVLTIMSFRLQ
jgi:hypothetical protein